MKLDKNDLAILSLLRDDARLSIRDIAAKIDMKPSTVHVRLTQLVKKGVIEKFTLKLNSKAFGEEFTVLILIKTAEEINQKWFERSEIKEIFGITGEYNFFIKAKFADLQAFNTFFMEFRKEEQIQEAVSMIGTSTLKEEI